MNRKFGMLVLSLIILSVFAAVNATALSEDNESIEDVPDLPLILRGGMNVNGEPVSAGREITAYYDGELVAKSTIEENGKYTLNLNLNPENYTSVENMELYINNTKVNFEIPVSQIEAVHSMVPGSIIEVDINSSVSSIDSGTGSGGSSGSTGEARVVNKGVGESEPSDKTGSHSEANLAGKDEDGITELEDPVSLVDDEESEGPGNVEGEGDAEDAEDAGEAESAEGAGYSTVFMALLFIGAFLGAFMIIKR
ncbi:hypothetical protein RSJ42_17660 [Methanosarcina hadiensis]|uniref:hypothetical protein n=1 Tax=Methanosarcina hadiensis TaxID=3078083 RepID=UPI0039775668